MTGQITPYYLKNPGTDTYHHLNYVSVQRRLRRMHQRIPQGRKVCLTNARQEVAYYRTKTNHILSKPLP
ncbi:MAG: hypothetical protein ACLT29_02950 [Ruminococcus callidus]